MVRSEECENEGMREKYPYDESKEERREDYKKARRKT